MEASGPVPQLAPVVDAEGECPTQPDVQLRPRGWCDWFDREFFNHRTFSPANSVQLRHRRLNRHDADIARPANTRDEGNEEDQTDH